MTENAAPMKRAARPRREVVAWWSRPTFLNLACDWVEDARVLQNVVLENPFNALLSTYGMGLEIEPDQRDFDKAGTLMHLLQDRGFNVTLVRHWRTWKNLSEEEQRCVPMSSATGSQHPCHEGAGRWHLSYWHPDDRAKGYITPVFMLCNLDFFFDYFQRHWYDLFEPTMAQGWCWRLTCDTDPEYLRPFCREMLNHLREAGGEFKESNGTVEILRWAGRSLAESRRIPCHESRTS
jgi:hypothetical protein